VPEETTTQESQEQTEVEGQEPTTETAETQDDTSGGTEEQETFDRAYVERLRREAAERRTKEKEAREELERIKTAQQQEKEAADQANMTELQKLQSQAKKIQEERDSLEAERDEAYTALARMTEENAVRAALADANLKPARLAAALKLVDFDSLDVDDEGQITGVKEAVKAVKAESPEWFQTANVGNTGAAPGNEPQGKKSVADMTDEELAQLSQQVQWGQRITL